MKLNGNLTLNDGGASEIQNAIIERVASNPTILSSEKGRIVFNSTDALYYYNNGTVWQPFATGGNAASLQTEVNAIETTLGTTINADGTFNSTAFSGFNNVTGPTSVTNVLSQLDAAIQGQNQLSELDDVTLTSLASGEYLRYNGTIWVNDAIQLADLDGLTVTAAELNELHSAGATNADFVKLVAVTSSAAELNILDGATLTVTELNYVDGVTSSIQTQLDNKQPLDATLTGLAALPDVSAVANQVAFTSDGTTFSYDAGAGARGKLGLTIGTNVQAWDADLDTVAGFVPASATETPAGQASRTVYDIMVGTGTSEGSRWTLQRGASARSSLGLGDIAVYDATSFIKTDGTSTITANITLSGFKLTSVATPTDGTDAANKAYVDALASGLLWKDPVNLVNLVDVATAPVGSPVDLDAYIISSGGATGAWSSFTVGDVVQWHNSDTSWHLVKHLTVGDRYGIAFVNETAGPTAFAGKLLQIATVTSATAGAETFTFEVPSVNDSVFIGDPGAALFGRSYTYVASTAAPTGQPTHNWVQFSGPGSTVAGTGLYYSGNTLHIGLGAGIAELPGDEVGIDLYDSTTGAIILTTNGADRAGAPGTNAKLHLKAHTSQFDQDLTNGLFLKNGGVTEAILNASVAGDGLVGGNGTALAVASAAGTGSTGGDTPASWAGVGTLDVQTNSVGVLLGNTSTSAAPGNHTHKASAITSVATGNVYATTLSVQGDLAALDQAIENVIAGSGSTITSLQTEVDNIEAGTGLNTDGTYTAIVAANYATGSDLKTAVTQLDTQVKTDHDARVTLANKLAASYFLYTGASSTGHTVTHNIGQKFCNVTVVDASDEVIIPQSIKFDTANQLTVTFNTAIGCKVICMGVS
jgi:hypothetical protein